MYNNSYVTTKEVRIYTEMHRVFLCVFFLNQLFFSFLLIPKRVVKHFYITRVYKCTIIQSEVCGH